MIADFPQPEIVTSTEYQQYKDWFTSGVYLVENAPEGAAEEPDLTSNRERHWKTEKGDLACLPSPEPEILGRLFEEHFIVYQISPDDRKKRGYKLA